MAGVVFKPLSAANSCAAENELEELLTVVAQDAASKIDRKEDELGFNWIVVRDNEIEDLVTTVHLIGSELAGARLRRPAARRGVQFKGDRNPVYLIYGYKRAAFWPFVPSGEEKERDNAQRG